MKEGWTYKKLGEVCEILDSQRRPITKGKRESGAIPYYGATGVLDYVKDFIFDEKLVLLGEDGAKWGAGDKSSFIISGKSWVNNHAHVLRLKQSILIDEILVYYLNFSNLQSYITGVTVPKLNQERMRSIEIPVPPLSEQQGIVSYLDSAFAQIDELKAKAEKQLSEAKALFQKALSKAMEPKEGWEEKTLKGLTTKIGSGATPKGGKKVYIGEGTSLVRSMNVHNNEFKYKDLAHINKDASTQLDCVELKPKDVLFNITGASIARCCIVPDNILPARVNQHVSILRPITDIISPQFLCLVLLSASHQKELLAIGVAGSTRQAITKSDLENHVIKIPSLSDQHRIVTYLDTFSEKVKSLEANLNKVTAECAALKQSILRQVFE